MKITEYQTDIDEYSALPFDEYFGDLSVGFFDLETTGLSPDRCSIILAGLVLPSRGKYLARQYFAEDIEEEPELLATLIDDMYQLDAVVTYNGHRFDMPFLKKRIAVNGLPPVSPPYDLDLYRLVRYHSDIKNFLPNLKQKTLEDFLGLWSDRKDEIDGGRSVSLYYDWLADRDPDVMDTICLHNRDDILQMTRMMRVITKTDFHKAMTCAGFPAGDLLITGISLNSSRLHITGKQMKDPTDYVYYGDDALSFRFSSDPGYFTIDAGVHQRGGLVFADLSESGVDAYRFRNDPALDEYLLVLKTNKNVDYRAVNDFVRALTERIEELWTIEK
ncbi:MAG: ribonuclease H-like domain-containing protein [Eubacteriaceae bacterium]|nr:ribonuclease H-like domain-containing protein [Eubacteriaceae bacterium]